jgi:hypothetical protein
MVNMTNYEEYMLLYADRELKPEEEQALLAFVTAHPELKAELEAYAATRMQPDEAIVYEGKDSLLKTAEPVRRIGLGNWKMYMAAACVLLVAVLFITNRKNTDETADLTTVKETITAPVTKNPQAPIHETLDDTTLNNIALQKKVHSTQPVNTIAVKKAAVKQEIIAVNKVPVKHKVTDPATIATHRKRDTTVQTIAHAPKEKTTTQPELPAVGEEATPQVVDGVTIPGRKKSGIANRFIAAVLGDKPQGIEGLEAALDDKLAAAKNIGEEIKDTEVKLRIGKKELLIVRL